MEKDTAVKKIWTRLKNCMTPSKKAQKVFKNPSAPIYIRVCMANFKLDLPPGQSSGHLYCHKRVKQEGGGVVSKRGKTS